MRAAFFYERKRISGLVEAVAEELRYEKISRATAYGLYGLNALVTVAAATYLPSLGEQIAARTGLGQTFVGSIFIALSTSLPEIVVSVAALGIGAVDLAVGNLFGSNLFNILILAVDDAVYARGGILSFTSPNHLVTAAAAMVMTAIAAIGLTYRAGKKRFLFAWDSLAIVAVYVTTLLILYTLR
jgi:cation:H+ antiporter